MAKPKLALIPAAQGDKFYSVLPSDGVGDFDFTRNSSATRIAPTGFIETSELFGSELVTNGNFDNDSDWNKGTGWTISGGTGNCDGTGANALLYQNNIFISGKNYNINFRITSYTSGVLRLRDNGVLLPTNYTAIGNYTLNLTATQTGFIGFQNYSSFIGSIDNISVVEVIGKSRLNYDLLNGKVVNCPHYLLEPASTNLLTYSEDFSNAFWNKLGSSVVSGFTSPDGGLNAYKLVEDSANSQHGLLHSNFPINVQRTLSVFAKKGENNRIFISDYNKFGATIGVIFNIEIGIVESNQNDSVYLNPKIESYPNDWYKCSVTWTNSTGLTVPFFGNAVSGTNSYQGDGVSGIYVFGAMFEELSYPTSYIPTNGTAITRAAESANGSGDAATFNDSEGVLMAEVKKINETTATSSIVISDGTNVNRVQIALIGGTNVIYGYIQSAGAGGTVITSNVPDFKSTNKVLVKYNTTQVSLWINGFEANTVIGNYTWSNGALNELSFETGAGSENFYGNTRQLQYFDSALTDAQLETLTSWTSLQEMITSQLYTNY